MYDANVTTESSVRLPSLLAPILERWRVLLLLTFGAAIAAGLFARLRAPRYVASMSVATITSSRTLNLGGAAALLGAGAAQGGFQLTPSLIADLMKSRRVLVPVGSALAPGGTETVASRIRGRTVEPVHVWENMQRAVSANVDQQTGLVEVDVTATDSALARFVADSVYEETTRAFVQTARAQASLQRRGQEARVDSALHQLRAAESRLVEFLSANRTLSQYSVATLQRQALDRDILLTQNVYTQAVTDREAAKARELEETPVLVIVDSLAAQFGTKPRYSMIAALAGALAALLLSLFVIFLTEQFRRQAHADDPDVQRLNAAIRSLPGVSMLDRKRDARPADIRVD